MTASAHALLSARRVTLPRVCGVRLRKFTCWVFQRGAMRFESGAGRFISCLRWERWRRGVVGLFTLLAARDVDGALCQ
jgi:hypothetical protein